MKLRISILGLLLVSALKIGAMNEDLTTLFEYLNCNEDM